jgi:hypothetical protein
MSSLTKNLPKRILNSIKNIEKKIMTYPVESKIKSIRDKYKDQEENRELLVVDKHGNRYYQYYSNQGLPTKRIVHLNQTSFNKWQDDPFMSSWLQKRRVNPPTQEELEKSYIELEDFQRRCLEWDKKENKMLEDYRKLNQKAIEEEKKDTKAIGIGENFRPGVWEKTQPIKIEKNEIENIEGVSKMPGKYISDMLDEDQLWMKARENKLLKKIDDALMVVDKSKYTIEIMAQRNFNENIKNRKESKIKIKQMTNLGLKMMEKEKQLKAYSNFRSRFKDVFKEFDDNENDNENYEESKELNKNVFTKI